MPCIKGVVTINCQYCRGETIKFGLNGGSQRYRCKKCNRVQLAVYKKHAYQASVNANIAAHIKEGCGIRSIARLLRISAGTVLRRIKIIAGFVKKPTVLTGQTYEVDELRTYIGNKYNECWVIYALDKQSGQVVDIKVGKRNKKNLKRVTDTLLLAECRKIYTDRLDLYSRIIPPLVHRTRRYGTNKIERTNLSLRTHLKRLNRKTICFSKKLSMLEACLKIYFWYKNPGLLM